MLISTIVGLLILRNKNILGQSAGCHDSLIVSARGVPCK